MCFYELHLKQKTKEGKEESEFHYNVIHESIDCTITDLLVGLVWFALLENDGSYKARREPIDKSFALK